MSVPHMAGLVFSKWVLLNPEPISTARHHDDQGGPFQVDMSLLSRLWQVSFQESGPESRLQPHEKPYMHGPGLSSGQGLALEFVTRPSEGYRLLHI